MAIQNLGKVVPAKGIDYWTNQDKQEIVNETKSEINIENYALISETGNKLGLSINNTTYVMTVELKDKNNNVLDTKTVDLPLETMVVNASYNNTTKEITLTLQNGNTTSFSVADLVSGLQTEITSTNKLSSDLVDDTNSTNKFTTTNEKNIWSGKYDKPAAGIPSTDLSSAVQTSLGKADSALQNHQDITGKEDKTNKVTQITSSSTNEQYPSAQAVYTLFNSITNGDNVSY